ncbi:MAG: hypothetical protein M1830_001513 [Pleopsidium flavum]|nr:MAG: hypothetical protein M1830_001513 [Pleopsidium flavum]
MAPSRAALAYMAAAITRTRPTYRAAFRIRGRCHSSLPRLSQSPLTQPSILYNCSRRLYSAGTALSGDDGPEPPDYLSDGERLVFDKLKKELGPSKLEVQDISGGCGSMYAIDVVSSKFKGLSMIKQHRLVNQVLEGEIKGWHGVQLKTKAA